MGRAAIDFCLEQKLCPITFPRRALTNVNSHREEEGGGES